MKYIVWLFVVFAFIPAAQAGGLVCDTLKKPETYKNWQSYRYLVEGADGWIFRTETDFRDDFPLNDRDIARLSALNDAFKAQGTTLILSILPTRGLMEGKQAPPASVDMARSADGYARLIKTLRGAGLHVAAIEGDTGAGAFYYKRDHHWTPVGAKAMAQAVAAQVKALDIPLTEKKFVSEAQKTIDHVGTFEKLIKESCGVAVPPEQVTEYITYAPGDADALFDDVGAADIVLLGTSNSTSAASHANYDGFLKEALSADVENRAISGGGADAAMLQYLAARPENAKKPRVIIWEFPVYQDFHSKNFLRQAIPAVNGVCASPVAVQDKTIEPFMEMFAQLKDKKIQGENYYLHVRVTPPTELEFRAVMAWDNGSSDFFTFKRDPFYTPDGIYFLDFEKGKPPLSALKLQFPDTVTGTVSATLCRK